MVHLNFDRRFPNIQSRTEFLKCRWSTPALVEVGLSTKNDLLSKPKTKSFWSFRHCVDRRQIKRLLQESRWPKMFVVAKIGFLFQRYKNCRKYLSAVRVRNTICQIWRHLNTELLLFQYSNGLTIQIPKKFDGVIIVTCPNNWIFGYSDHGLSTKHSLTGKL